MPTNQLDNSKQFSIQDIIGRGYNAFWKFEDGKI